MSRLINADEVKRFADSLDSLSESQLIDVLYVIANGIPTVDAEPVRHAHWVLEPSKQGERDFIWWKCSECGRVIYSVSNRDRREFHAYCGRCGAKMDEVTE